MAHLKKRNNTWFAVWTQNGKRVVKSTGVKVEGDITASKLKKIAHATAQSMEAAAKGSLTVDAALDAVRSASRAMGVHGDMPTLHEYLSGFEPSGKVQNVSNSKRAIARFLAFAKEHHHTKLDSVPVAVCREWLRDELLRVSVGTATNYKKTLSAVFTRAMRDEILNRNPFALLRMNEVVSGLEAAPAVKRLPFSADEMRLLLTKLPHPWREMVLISFLTGGQRIGDVACLRWDAVNFDERLISFHTQKTGHAVDSPIVPELYSCLLSLRQARDGYSPYVLPAMAERYGRAAGTLSTEFTGLLRGLGIIPPLAARTAGKKGGKKSVAPKSFHSIRHTVVSMLRSSNAVSPDLARAIVGHDSEEIERQYFTASQNDKLSGLSILEQVISEGGNDKTPRLRGV